MAMSLWKFRSVMLFYLLQILSHGKCLLTAFIFAAKFPFSLAVEHLSGHILLYSVKNWLCCTAYRHLCRCLSTLEKHQSSSVLEISFYSTLLMAIFFFVWWNSIPSGTVQAQNTLCTLFGKVPLHFLINAAPEITFYIYICCSSYLLSSDFIC